MLTSRRRYWREILGVELRFWVRERWINDWIDRTDFFFILGLGRSGTRFLARLLDQTADAQVVHEPLRADFVAYRRAFHNDDEAQRYLRQFRKKEIYLRARERRTDIYGEVNSLLRRHAAALQETFPKATLLHLIRDGRDVIRSMMARRTLMPGDPSTIGIRPADNDPWAEKWPEMDRFSQLCWYWRTENRYLRKTIQGPAVQFELILNEYDYFQARVLEPCHLELPSTVWQQAVERPTNVTMHHQLPPWEAWSPSRRQTFLQICGEEMEENGYKI